MKPDYEAAWKMEEALSYIRNFENLQAKRKSWHNRYLRSVNGTIKKYYPCSNTYRHFDADHFDINKRDWIIESIPIKFYSIQEAQKAFKEGKYIKHENWKKWYHKDGEVKICHLGTVLLEMQEERWLIK